MKMRYIVGVLMVMGMASFAEIEPPSDDEPWKNDPIVVPSQTTMREVIGRATDESQAEPATRGDVWNAAQPLWVRVRVQDAQIADLKSRVQSLEDSLMYLIENSANIPASPRAVAPRPQYDDGSAVLMRLLEEARLANQLTQEQMMRQTPRVIYRNGRQMVEWR